MWDSFTIPLQIDEQLIAYVLRSVCTTLAELHAANILHRDIKAANIFIMSDGSIKVFSSTHYFSNAITRLAQAND
jgi:serine/threonine protein kinase